MDRVVVQRKPLTSPLLRWLSGRTEMLYVEITPSSNSEATKRTQAGERLKPSGPPQDSPGGCDEVWVWNAMSQHGEVSSSENKLTFEALTSTEFVLQVVGGEEKGWFAGSEKVEHLAEARFRADEDFVPVVGLGGSVALPLVRDSRVRGAVTLTVALRCDGPVPTPTCTNGNISVIRLSTEEDTIVPEGDDMAEQPRWPSRYARMIGRTDIDSPKFSTSEPMQGKRSRTSPAAQPWEDTSSKAVPKAVPVQPPAPTSAARRVVHPFARGGSEDAQHLTRQTTDPFISMGVLPLPAEEEEEAYPVDAEVDQSYFSPTERGEEPHHPPLDEALTPRTPRHRDDWLEAGEDGAAPSRDV